MADPRTTALLPCPFCGGPGRLIIGEANFYAASVRCETCNAETASIDADDGAVDELERNTTVAIAAWNRRVA